MTDPGEQFEHDPSLEALEQQLGEALAAQPPADLADRIHQATVDGLPTGVERELSHALAAEAPDDLADRVYAATVDQVTAAETQPQVIAKIGPRPWMRWAAAAVMLFTVGGSIWMAKGLDTTNALARATSLPTEADWNAVNLALNGEPTDLDNKLTALSSELDELAVSLSTDSDDLLDDMLYSDDLDALENRVREF